MRKILFLLFLIPYLVFGDEGPLDNKGLICAQVVKCENEFPESEFHKKKYEAQLQFDILREENKSDNFFDDKINFLLEVTSKTTEKVNEDNLLNFYLSSVTIKDFKYEPKKDTTKIIWEYLNAANLITIENIQNLTKSHINEILTLAESYANNKVNKFNHLMDKTIASLFFEPSTRTSASFQVAAKRLGAETIIIDEKKIFCYQG